MSKIQQDALLDNKIPGKHGDEATRLTLSISRLTSQLSSPFSHSARLMSPSPRLPSHVSRLTSPLSRLTSHVSRLTIAALLLLLASCRPAPQYQEHYNIPGAAWDAAYQPQFHFTIDDTAAAYQLFLLVRHTDAYPFSNIWIAMDSKAPGDTTWGKARVEIPLAAPSGQWLGRGAGELWEQKVPITTPAKPAFFPRKGDYIVRLAHDMRRNPLPEVLTIGLRLEKLPHFTKE